MVDATLAALPATAGRDGDTRAGEAGRDQKSVSASVVTINKPARALYDVWRDFAKLGAFMENIERIDVIDHTRSHWVVNAPGGRTVE